MEKKWKYFDEAKQVVNTLNSYKSVVIYDVETTGLKKNIDKIIQFSAIRYEIPSWKELARIDIYIKSPFAINGSIASEKNGITDELLEEKGISEEEAFKQISSFISKDDLISGYNNTRFDNKMMEVLYKNHGQVFEYKDNIDVYKFVKTIIPPEAVTIKTIEDGKEKIKVSYTLENVTRYYDPENETVFHSSINDVEATGFVFAMVIADLTMQIAETEEQENKRKDIPRQDAKVFSISLFNPSKLIKRVYVYTDQGSIFYDELSHEWKAKTGSIDSLNVKGILNQVFAMLNIESEADLYNAAVRADKDKQAMNLLDLKKGFTSNQLEENYASSIKKLDKQYALLTGKEKLSISDPDVEHALIFLGIKLTAKNISKSGYVSESITQELEKFYVEKMKEYKSAYTRMKNK